MRRFLAACLAAAMMACACAAGAPEEGMPASPGAIAWFIVRSGCDREPASLERVDQTRDADTVADYIAQVYGLEPGSWTDAAIYRAGGVEAFEVAVLRLGDEKAAKKAVGALEDYIEAREADFAGYEPEQADIVQHSKAVWSGQGDAALLICEDPESAEAAFEVSYETMARKAFDPPGKDDMTLYDTSAILAAWDSGDASGLTEKDAAILDMAAAVLEEVTTEDMTEYEREKALYGWITANAVYDQDHYDKLAEMDPDSSGPYGLLKNHKGICVGFATTFQLFMDMTGVECITVVGASRSSAADHAWNMVRLNGKWYCADSTWDVEDTDWSYFNVTSDWMAFTDHQWDYETVPEATAEDGGAGA